MSTSPTIGVVCGSHRIGSETARIGRFIEKTLDESTWCETTWCLDLGGNPLPLWTPEAETEEAVQRVASQLQDSDGFVILSPEWHGMVPAGLKNFFLLYAGGVLAHKPALLVSVSAGMGGAYPIAELRMSSYKNSRICYLPEHLVVRNAAGVFHEEAGKNDAEADRYLRRRLQYALGILREYALALRQVRASGAGDSTEFRAGM